LESVDTLAAKNIAAVLEKGSKLEQDKNDDALSVREVID
jgi:hypothetical protein